MPDIARAHPDECTACRGRGQTQKCATLMAASKPGSTKLKTIQQGSGCLLCLGVGRTSKQQEK